MTSPFSALHDLSALASTLSPSPLVSAAPGPASPIPMHSQSASHAYPPRSSYTPPSEASYSSTPSLSFSASVQGTSPYAPSLAGYATANPAPGGLAAAAGKEHRKHRRQSSSSGHKRRLSDARDALSMTRAFMTADSPPLGPTLTSQSVPATSYLSARGGSTTKRESSKSNSDDGAELMPKDSAGKKLYICDDCQKVYRHRSCMDKHRWEHSPQWLQSSKFLLSKHQQVQLLEAATILSHLSAPSQSLPEDRSLWPKYLAEVTTPVGSAPQSGMGRPAHASKWSVPSNGRKSVSAYDGESVLGEIDMDDASEDLDVVGGDGDDRMSMEDDDEETEDEIEVVRPWTGVGGLEMEL
ncbi:hypothetical protein DACRYDRAFT_109675 [Dacryopinax primogenitus]|uniref:C2H2-type domain-containing protein n=1 Tax=Dacryopinax primogenitus (strain DJM 731) TaxID=1858805 RepID=M5G740_DACPD|nr:uncharacterized protein DACRYDRAFT_109675 [Dacryopinax primogenitus]EJT99577.1 hypothetical protein DACRYDRAFT_109675 [Dacryopinax primogenitus]